MKYPKWLCDNMHSQMIAPREKAIEALMTLQALGITDGEILNIYVWLKKLREKSPIAR